MVTISILTLLLPLTPTLLPLAQLIFGSWSTPGSYLLIDPIYDPADPTFAAPGITFGTGGAADANDFNKYQASDECGAASAANKQAT